LFSERFLFKAGAELPLADLLSARVVDSAWWLVRVGRGTSAPHLPNGFRSTDPRASRARAVPKSCSGLFT